MENGSSENWFEQVQDIVGRIPAPLRDELRFEQDMFVSRLELLEARGLSPDRRSDINYSRIRVEMYEFLKDDLVDFMHKILAGRNLPEDWPSLRPIHKTLIRLLKELGVYFYYPPGKTFETSSIPERWFTILLRDFSLNLRQVTSFFLIYRNRLYSLTEESPFSFKSQRQSMRMLIRRTMRGEALPFEKVYRAELHLREQIQFALLRRFSPSNRLHYLVGKEMIQNLSDQFITSMHTEVEYYFLASLRLQRIRHASLMRERQAIEKEVSNAARSQKKNLQRLPEGDERIRFDVFYQPYMSVSGDFYRVLRPTEDEYFVFLADIAGHGLGAAMYFNTLLHAFEKFERYYTRPHRLLEKLDRELYGKLDDNFITAIAIHVDVKRYVLTYANAGHPKGFLVLQAPETRVRFLRQTGRVLGVFPKSEYRSYRLDIDHPSRLMVYTDGLSETTNDAGDMIGERGLLRLFDGTPNMASAEAIETFRERLDEFQGRSSVEDDRSLIVADIKGST